MIFQGETDVKVGFLGGKIEVQTVTAGALVRPLALADACKLLPVSQKNKNTRETFAGSRKNW